MKYQVIEKKKIPLQKSQCWKKKSFEKTHFGNTLASWIMKTSVMNSFEKIMRMFHRERMKFEHHSSLDDKNKEHLFSLVQWRQSTEEFFMSSKKCRKLFKTSMVCDANIQWVQKDYTCWLPHVFTFLFISRMLRVFAQWMCVAIDGYGINKWYKHGKHTEATIQTNWYLEKTLTFWWHYEIQMAFLYGNIILWIYYYNGCRDIYGYTF